MNRPHHTRPGAVSVTIESADEETVLTFAHALSTSHNVTGLGAPWRVPGRPGVRVHVYGNFGGEEAPDPVTCCALLPKDCQWRASGSYGVVRPVSSAGHSEQQTGGLMEECHGVINAPQRLADLLEVHARLPRGPRRGRREECNSSSAPSMVTGGGRVMLHAEVEAQFSRSCLEVAAGYALSHCGCPGSRSRLNGGSPRGSGVANVKVIPRSTPC
ncbi:DUF6207 family protein [Streptomyces sp. NPDC056975]|uniref:DUF6207 family protein n=1 Tax=Streptomyces sp. NPDC056975 TaxID=3345985 RepID=UPI00362B8927